MRQLEVFVSYSHDDGAEFATRLGEILRSWSPPLHPWIDKDDPGGRPWQPTVKDKIGSCDVLLFVMTQRSADPSSYCQDEISYARERRKRILTLVKDDEANRLPLDVQRVPRIPFTRGSEDLGWQELRQKAREDGHP